MTEQWMCLITSVSEESYRSSGRTIPVLRSCYWERADMKPMSKEVKQRRWTLIGHTLKQDQNSDLQHSNDLGTRRKKKKRKTKNYLEANGWKGKGRSGMAIVAGRVKTIAANWDKWRDSVKALCATRHEEYRRGEVRVQGFGRNDLWDRLGGQALLWLVGGTQGKRTIVAPKVCTYPSRSIWSGEWIKCTSIHKWGEGSLYRFSSHTSAKKTFASIVWENGLNFSNAYQEEISVRISDLKK